VGVMRRAIIALGIPLACCACAFALGPSLDISQYAHTAWTIRDGFLNGEVWSIAQTPDGYLWLGTDFGLVRFDGVRFIPWSRSEGEHLPTGRIRALFAAHDGTLWIGGEGGLASWKDAKLTLYRELAGMSFLSIIEDREGTIWAGGGQPTGGAGRLCAIQGGAVTCHGENRSLQLVVGLYEDRRGNLWASTSAGVWLWKPGPARFFAIPGVVNSLAEDDKKGLLVLTRAGIRRLLDGRTVEDALVRPYNQFIPFKLLPERNGDLWIATVDGGVLHRNQGTTDRFAQFDGLSGDWVHALYEDREGSVWVGTSGGLDRFRDYAVSTMTQKQGLSNMNVESLLAGRDGTVWMGTFDGLNRWKDGVVTVYRARPTSGREAARGADRQHSVREVVDPGLPQDIFFSIFEDHDGRIWASASRGLSFF
jgi:ligand-binding sensor domain-containing protein